MRVQFNFSILITVRWKAWDDFASNCLENFISFFWTTFLPNTKMIKFRETRTDAVMKHKWAFPKVAMATSKLCFSFYSWFPKIHALLPPLERNYTNNSDQFICKKKYTNYDITRQSLNCCPTFIVLKFFIWIYIRWRLLY